MPAAPPVPRRQDRTGRLGQKLQGRKFHSVREPRHSAAAVDDDDDFADDSSAASYQTVVDRHSPSAKARAKRNEASSPDRKPVEQSFSELRSHLRHIEEVMQSWGSDSEEEHTPRGESLRLAPQGQLQLNNLLHGLGSAQPAATMIFAPILTCRCHLLLAAAAEEKQSSNKTLPEARIFEYLHSVVMGCAAVCLSLSLASCPWSRAPGVGGWT